MYSETVMDHFTNPRNLGTISNASGVGIVKSPVDNDTVQITIMVERGVISDAKFKCMGCGAAIATSSMATEMIKGKSLEEACLITNELVAEALGGIPDYKMLCSNLAPDAIKLAIESWRMKQQQATYAAQV